MKKHMIVCCVFIAVLVSGCVSIPASADKREGQVPAILLDAGKKLGVNFSDSIFANQTKCYDNPFEDFYKNTGRRYYVICLSDAYPMTRIFWLNKKLALEELISENLNDVLDIRIKNGFATPTTQRKIKLLRDDGNVLYHKVNLDPQYNLVQATFFVPVTEDHEVDLITAIMIRAASLETAEQTVNKMLAKFSVK